MLNRFANTQDCSFPSSISLSLNPVDGAADEERLGPLLVMVYCHTKIVFFFFFVLSQHWKIYRAAAVDVLIQKPQTLMSNHLHDGLDLSHTSSRTHLGFFWSHLL